MEPLGAYEPWVGRSAGVALGLLAALTAATLFELSRQLAERHKGRWYAGNGRDVFHAGAGLTLAIALLLNGLPPAVAFAIAGSVSAVPLAVLDSIASQRRRALVLLAAVSLGVLPALVAPRAVVGATNAAARVLFR
jgi:hypothetical protein